MKKIGAKIFVNSITLFRLLGTFLIPFMCYNMKPENIIIYITVLLLTDSIDGIMARRLEVSTLFGALLDALADKLLGIATFALLATSEPIMLLPIIVEATIMIINTKGATKGSSIESSKLGKLKTWVMGISIVIGFLTIYANDFINLFNELSKEGEYLIRIFTYLKDNHNAVVISLACITVGADLIVAYDYHNKNKSEITKAKEDGINPKEIKLKKGKDLVYALFDEKYYLETLNEPILVRLGTKECKNERKNKRK